jgi:hypothetical protein
LGTAPRACQCVFVLVPTPMPTQVACIALSRQQTHADRRAFGAQAMCIVREPPSLLPAVSPHSLSFCRRLVGSTTHATPCTLGPPRAPRVCAARPAGASGADMLACRGRRPRPRPPICTLCAPPRRMPAPSARSIPAPCDARACARTRSCGRRPSLPQRVPMPPLPFRAPRTWSRQRAESRPRAWPVWWCPQAFSAGRARRAAARVPPHGNNQARLRRTLRAFIRRPCDGAQRFCSRLGC